MNRATGNPHENSVAGADLAKVLPRTGGGRRNANGSSVAGGAKERRRIRSPTARSLCGLNLNTVAALMRAAIPTLHQAHEIIRERCYANLHLTWSVHFGRRERHAG